MTMAKPRTTKPKPAPTPSTIDRRAQASVAATISDVLAKHAAKPTLTIAPQQLALPRALALDAIEIDVQAARSDEDDAWRPLDRMVLFLLQLGDLLRAPELHDLSRSVERLADLNYSRSMKDAEPIAAEAIDLPDLDDALASCSKGDLPWDRLDNFLRELGDLCDAVGAATLSKLRDGLFEARSRLSQVEERDEPTLEERLVWHLWAGNNGKPVSVAQIAIDRGIPRDDVNIDALIDSERLDQVEVAVRTGRGQVTKTLHYQPTQAWVLAVARHDEALPPKPPVVQGRK